MNKYYVSIFSAFLFIIVLNSCDDNNPVSDDDYKNNSASVKGNGVEATISRKIENYRKLDLMGGFNVNVKSGNSDSILITTDENILPYIKTEVKDYTLQIYPDTAVSPQHPMTIDIKSEIISSVTVTGKVNAHFAGVNDSRFDLKITGDGLFEIIEAIDSLFISIVGNADVRISADQYLKVEMEGKGTVYYKGNPVIWQSINGTGVIKKVN